jgi:Na+-translocating ferredoxin:NAD+ oxidoreductase RnfA subunit
MTTNLALAFLSGLFVYQPLVNFGLIPSSAEGMSRQPYLALGYSLTGGVLILVFGISSWILHYVILLPIKALSVELPLLLALMWGCHFLLKKCCHKISLLNRHLPFYFLNVAVLGSGLTLIHYTQHDIILALTRIFGISVGFVFSTLLVSFVREKAERKSFNNALRGWPVYLMVCAIFWLSYHGISLLF